MKGDKPKRISSSWAITFTVPNPEQTYKHYGLNMYVGVDADTMEQAIAIVRENYPEATFINIHHRGDVHFKV